jgi:hypothetical protein
VSRVVLVFDGDHEGDDPVEVVCDRMKLRACDVQAGDFIACAFTGFIHVHEIETRGRIIYFTDCIEHQHLYRVDDLLELARPQD